MKRYLWLIGLLMLLCSCSAYAAQDIITQRTELDNGYRIDYVDASGHVVFSENKGYSTIIATYHDQDTVREMFFNEHGDAVAISNGAYGRLLTDMPLNRMYITYLDMTGEPMVTRSGYTSVLRTVENGNLMQEMYLDSEGNNISLSEGQFGYKRQYDKQGRVASVVYLDKNGEQAMTYRGYDEIRREYDEWGQLQYQWYYLNGHRITLKNGQAGVQKAGDREYPVDLNGQRIFVLAQFLQQNHWLCWIAALLIIAAVLQMPIRMRWGIFACYCLFILYMTVLTREHTEYRYNFDLLLSYKSFFVNSRCRTEILNNILLFIPFSLMLYLLWPRKYGVIVISVLCSVMIEVYQLVFKAGSCQLSDVVNNSIGALLGVLIYVLVSKLQRLFAMERRSMRG